MTLVLGLSFVHADIVPVTSTRSLVDSTDLIIAGTVEHVARLLEVRGKV